MRAGQAAMKVNAAEQVTHFERALSLWDRVPDAEAVAGRTRIELTCAARPGGDAAARPRRVVPAHPAGGRHAGADHGSAGGEPGLLRSGILRVLRAGPSRPRGGDPPRRRVRRRRPDGGTGLGPDRAGPSCITRNDRFAAALEGANAAVAAAEAADCTDPLIWAMNCRNVALAYLGRLTQACAGADDLIALARRTGMSGAANNRASWLAFTLMELRPGRSGDVPRP